MQHFCLIKNGQNDKKLRKCQKIKKMAKMAIMEFAKMSNIAIDKKLQNHKKVKH
jgi:hypothetical protein